MYFGSMANFHPKTGCELVLINSYATYLLIASFYSVLDNSQLLVESAIYFQFGSGCFGQG